VTLPNGTQITALVGGVLLLLQHLGLVMPNEQRADANRVANFMARDQLAQCHDERDKLLDRLMEVR